jgi:hypothetical protein
MGVGFALRFDLYRMVWRIYTLGFSSPQSQLHGIATAFMLITILPLP